MAIEASNNPFSCGPNQTPTVDLSDYALKSNVLQKDNVTPYAPTEDYHPSTKLFTEKASFQRQLSLIPKPLGYDFVPFEIIKYNGSNAELDNDNWLELFRTKYASNIVSGEIYVSELFGNDSNTGTINNPLKTTSAALLKTESTIYLFDGNYDAIDFRSTNPQGSTAKIFIGLGDNVTFKKFGGDLTSLTFTQDADVNVFKTVLTTSNDVNRILRSDLKDALGFDKPMAQRSSVLDLETNGYGWFYDISINTLYVYFSDSVGTDIPARELWFNTNVKPLLKAIYIDVSVSGNRMLFLDTKVFFKSIKFESLYFFPLNTTGELTKPVLWADNISLMYSNTTGISAEGCETFIKDSFFYRSNGDNLGYHVENGVECKAVEYDIKSYYAGDLDTYPNTTPNKNASSMHEKGIVLRINGDYSYSYPFNIIDTSDGTLTEVSSWNIGCKSKNVFGGGSKDINMFDRIVILDHVKAGTIQASDNSKITYNDLTVSALSILANGILEEYEF